jgi:hypothetical protein
MSKVQLPLKVPPHANRSALTRPPHVRSTPLRCTPHPVGRRYHIRAFPTICPELCLPYEIDSEPLLNEANIDSFERICHNIALAAAPGLYRAFDVGFSPWTYSHRVAPKSASEAFLYVIDLWMYIAPVGLYVWLCYNTPDSRYGSW